MPAPAKAVHVLTSYYFPWYVLVKDTKRRVPVSAQFPSRYQRPENGQFHATKGRRQRHNSVTKTCVLGE
jgi:hypothetical protein